MVDYHGRNVIIVGLGLTGLFCVDFFLARGVIPRIVDTRNTPPGLNRLPKYIKYHLGSLNIHWLLDADLVVASPGISLIDPIFEEVANAGIEIIGDIELFCREAKAPIIAITGSNGKSTVATLVSEMAKAADINVGIGGNIGLPALALLLNPMYKLYILELSSFQLETTFSLQPVAATILNITEDHMDRYPFGLQQYYSIKHRIYKNAQTCIINIDDILTIPTYSTCKRYISFGVNVGDYHLYHQDKDTWLCIQGEKVLNVKKMLLFGQHNYTNALAALALANAAGLPCLTSLKALTNFAGLEHRFQLILHRNGVRWINDSKSTNIGSTKAALSSLCVKGTLHLLLGGDGKSADFSLLKPWLTGNKIKIYCFGRDRSKLAALRPEISVQTETLKEAMCLLSSRVKPGDIALLSPACASVDQFVNFEQRGLIFTNLAKELG